jgi:hypothetical protein
MLLYVAWKMGSKMSLTPDFCSRFLSLSPGLPHRAPQLGQGPQRMGQTREACVRAQDRA